jgi:cbb3-type cytochrome oxidase subunit 3
MSMATVSLLFFFGLFVAIVAWVFVVPKSRWDRDAEIPLTKDPVENRNAR